MEYKNIVSQEIDLAGKTRVIVDVGERRIMLKFQTTPTEAEVITATNGYIATLAALATPPEEE